MTTHVNKVHHVTTLTQVAKDLGEDEDWLRDITIGVHRLWHRKPDRARQVL
ncbi:MULTISPECIES: hypothetical protein [Bradyrhizobium]|uniref:hypothetical protein n=1 Tax=Bradyrhizobium TaxID=374 RepID=UPI000B2C5BA7|nr:MULTISPECIES: hypothetical protein [Bradyrhizobium]MCA1545146.1 hypothetical protein [Bradyrhizobium sp. NBAIM32]UWU93615.1 hypothetical protein N2604_06810 [Bradyrhizobium sp. CB1015]